MMPQIVVLGGGSAGLLVALTLKRALPALPVRVIYSSEIGIIGVGEGTTCFFPQHLLGTLALDPAQLYAEAKPTWKLGLRMLWGPRDVFYYSFVQQFDARWSDLPKSNGYYCSDRCVPASLQAALMAQGKVAVRGQNGWPQLHPGYAFHIENALLVEYLARRCREAGVVLTEGKASQVEPGIDGVEALHLESGEKVTADLFVDASGFRSELLGRTLEEPFVSYGKALFCDRAVVGGWRRAEEPVLPYTTAETMNAGWAWQIEHEHFINRGYVFSSEHLSDDVARAEILQKNPKIAGEPRLVKFRSGRHERSWVGNVVAVGNAAGFVEPLEATALSTIVITAQSLVEILRESNGQRPSHGLVGIFNQFTADIWDETRDFLALHYKFNTRLGTPFWQMARAETPLGLIEPLAKFYQENGPSMLGRHLLGHPDNIFGLEGHLVMLVGQDVAYRLPHEPAPAEREIWNCHSADLMAQAANGLTVAETLACIRHPSWRWK